VQADFYKACEKLEGWKRLLEKSETLDPNSVMKEQAGEETEEQRNRPEFRIPAHISHLSADLARQMEAYRQRKASCWRVERVAANSTGFYSLYGRMWEFFCEQYSLKTASELLLDHVQKFITARLDAGRSPRTVNGRLKSLRSFLSFLKEDQVAIHPSLENIQRLKEAERLPR
jgi:hypothetical protein